MAYCKRRNSSALAKGLGLFDIKPSMCNTNEITWLTKITGTCHWPIPIFFMTFVNTAWNKTKLSYISHQIPTLKCVVSRLVVVFAQPIEVMQVLSREWRCSTPEWSIMWISTKVRLICEVWRYILWLIESRSSRMYQRIVYFWYWILNQTFSWSL